jgi:hypothetical protein
VSRSTLAVFAAYLLLSVAMTWPLIPGFGHDVPGDLGDSLLNLWIIAWGAEQVPRMLTGQAAVADYWNANIFHPEPLALSFSEHLFGQVLQILPVYHLTGNVILSYNLLFVSSFALSGLGMYVLVRNLLGEPPGFSGPAFVAGLVYAFVPFRIAQVAHIQSVSSQWMPLALYGFRRFIQTGRRRALAGGSGALLLQNWSCGYYLVFFAPFVPLFVIHQIVALGKVRDWRVWTSFAVAALVVAAGTWPFLALYLEAQRVHGFERSAGEVIRFSADVYSYFTAPEALQLWGNVMQAYPKPEGELFFGVMPMVLALVAMAAGTRLDVRRPIVAFLVGLAAIQLAAFIAILLTGGFVSSLIGVPVRATNPTRMLWGMLVVGAVLLAVSPQTRARARAAMQSPLALSLVLLAFAMWLSLGPLPQSRGRILNGLGLYGFFYDHVPGFDGLRVPARYAMIAAVFLSIAAGFGVRALVAGRRQAVVLTAALCVVFLAESAFAPMPLNRTWAAAGGVIPPDRVEPPESAPAVYRELAQLPDAHVVVEFPFGDPAWELRYVYYTTVHWKRLVNGYSGGFPQNYKVRVARLQRVTEDPDGAWQSVTAAGVTHAIVHDEAFPSGAADVVHQWLRARGAGEIGRYGGDVLYAVPRK